MKRTALALTLVFALLFSGVVGVQIVNLAEANPVYAKPLYCRISILSPQNITYSTEPIFLNFTAETNQGDFNANPYFYLLDGNQGESSVKVEEIKLIAQKRINDDLSPYERNSIPWEPYTQYTFRGQYVLPNLPNGPHNLTVYMGVDWAITNQASSNPFSATAEFNVETTSTETSQELQREPFQTTLIAAFAVSGAGAGLGLLVYFKKRKH